MDILQNEFRRRVTELDCSYICDEEKNKISVLCGDAEVAQVTANGEVTSNDFDNLTEDERDMYFKVKNMAGEINEYCRAYQNAEPLTADGVKDYRLLAEYNGVVMAAAYDEKFGMSFVTWERGYIQNSLYQGHYSTKYNESKEDFAVRSGLVPQEKIFSTYELENVQTCVNYTLAFDDMLNDVQQREIEVLKDKIDNSLSSVAEKPEQAQAPQLSM